MSFQAKGLLKFVEAISEKTLRSTVAMTAARGRGKSAALGLAMVTAVGFGYVPWVPGLPIFLFFYENIYCDKSYLFIFIVSFLISPQKHMLWYSLEAPRQDASNEYNNTYAFMEK